MQEMRLNISILLILYMKMGENVPKFDIPGESDLTATINAAVDLMDKKTGKDEIVTNIPENESDEESVPESANSDDSDDSDDDGEHDLIKESIWDMLDGINDVKLGMKIVYASDKSIYFKYGMQIKQALEYKLNNCLDISEEEILNLEYINGETGCDTRLSEGDTARNNGGQRSERSDDRRNSARNHGKNGERGGGRGGRGKGGGKGKADCIVYESDV